MNSATLDILEKTKSFIMQQETNTAYRTDPRRFSHTKKLSFKATVVLILQKLHKSLSLEVAHFFDKLSHYGGQVTQRASKSAFVQRRQGIQPRFFQDLLYFFNQQCARNPQIAPKRWKGVRVLACDTTVIELPASEELKAVYEHSVGAGHVRTQGRVSALYEVGSALFLDACLAPTTTDERSLAVKHFVHCPSNSLVIYDRGYPSYDFMYQHQQQGIAFVMRVPIVFNRITNDFLASGQPSAVVNFYPKARQDFQHLPYQKDTPLLVRLIRITLPDGQTELLATSLLDEQTYRQEDFAALYALRWQEEVRIDVLKNNLGLENFSGYSLLSVEQDLYAALFLLNLQALVTQEVAPQIEKSSQVRQHDYQVNQAVSLGFLKERVIDLFYNQQPEELLESLKTLFIQHVEPVRGGRRPERNPKKYKKKKKPKVTKNRKPVM